MHIVKFLLVLLLVTVTANLAIAGETRYEMRVDGLACPYCAYGIEKKFKAIDGVRSIDFDLERGLVIVVTDESIRFTEDKLRKLFDDAGFTFRSLRRLDEDEGTRQ
ncbi:MAG: heavy-metal-associated domain-containing protein [Woeseia sp.]